MKKHYFILVMGLVLALSLPSWAAMTHRYDFAVDANDLVAGLESTLVGDAYVQDGYLFLDGTDDWLEMDAAGIDANSYTAITLEMWYQPFEAGANDSWSMLAYLGGNNPDTTWMGVHYLFMTSARDDDVSRAAICTLNDSDPFLTESFVNGPEYDDGLLHHMVASVDDTKISFFIDGVALGTAQLSEDNKIGNISNELAFLGKGGYMNDPEWYGSILEFRIYDRAFGLGEVLFNEFFGTDVLKPLVMASMSPEYGTILDKDEDVALSWTLDTDILASADSYNLYVGSDPNIADPNIADPSIYASYVITDLLQPGDTVPGTSLDFKTQYYWRVDTVSGAETYQGVPMSFTTLPDAPVINEQPEKLVIADSADTVTLNVVTVKANRWKWYAASDPDTTVGDTATLVLTAVTAADEDDYKCDVWHTDATSVVITSEPSRVIARRMMGHWKMDGNYDDSIDEEIDGAVAHDGVLTVNTDVGGPGDPNFASEIGETGIEGTDAAWFFNDGDHLEIPDSDFFNYYHKGLTVSCWYLDTGSNWNHPIIKLEAGNGDASGYLFGVDADYRTDCRFIFENVLGWPGLNSDDGPDPDVDFTDGNWHLMTATYDASTGTATMYADGALVDTGTADFSSFGYPDSPLMLGGSNLNGNASINGGLDDVRVYSYPLSAADVAILYTDVKGGYVCVADSENPLTYDANNDCRVNLEDFADLFQLWLECDRIPYSECY